MVTESVTVSIEERALLAETRVGQLLLGKFRLEALIGIGGTSVVFEAIQPNGSHVAIKMLHADLAGTPGVRERFLAEGYAANRVSHAGVVTVRDEGTTDDGSVFLVMDLLRGQTLAERLEAGGELFSLAEVLEISGQLLDVLVHAHDRGIVHRDIKPENVFLTHEGRGARHRARHRDRRGGEAHDTGSCDACFARRCTVARTRHRVGARGNRGARRDRRARGARGNRGNGGNRAQRKGFTSPVREPAGAGARRLEGRAQHHALG